MAEDGCTRIAGEEVIRGALLTWTDTNQATGGVGSVQQVLVYTQNTSGQWVLNQTIDGSVLAVPTGIVDTAPEAIGRNTQTLSYNAFGEVTGRAMNGRVYESAEYDNAGHLWRSNAGDGITKLMYYDIRGNMTQQVTSANLPNNELNNLELYATAEDAHGAIATDYLEISGIDASETRYDLMGRAVLHMDPARMDGVTGTVRTPTTHMKYDRWGNVVEVTDPRNVDWRITYTYNSTNQQNEKSVVTVTNGTPTVLSSERNYYDEAGRLVGSWDANGNLTQTAYGGFGSTTTTFMDYTTESSTLNAFGERVSLKARDGITTSYGYDHMGNMVSTSKITSQVYYTEDLTGGNGMTRLQATGTWEVREEFGYDELGRRYITSEFTQRSGQPGTRRQVVSNMTRYDLAGNVIGQIDSGGNQTRAIYDAYGHKVAEIDGAGKAMTWRVDPFGRVVSHVDQGGALVRYAYDGQGHLIHQWSSVRQGSGAQDIVYTYEDGLLTQINDRGTGLVTTYQYDLAGNRVLERAVSTTAAQGTTVVQNNHITYDQRGWMTHVEDDQFKVDIAYDNNGNRTRVTTHYVNSAGATVDTDVWNTYDSMNREVVVNGIKASANSSPSMGSSGHQIAYDSLGRRQTDTYMFKGVPTTETYSYDDLGRLSTVNRDGVIIEQRYYDEFGRVVQSGPQQGANEARLKEFGIATEIKTYHYNAAGKLDRMKYFSLKGDKLDDIYYRVVSQPGSSTYDGAGNLLQYTIVRNGDTNSPGRHSVYNTTFAYFDSAKEVQVKGTIGSTTQYTNTTLDANGNVIAVVDTSAPNKNRSFINDATGKVLITKQGNEIERTLIVNGEVLGSNSNDADPSNFANAYESATSSANLASPSIYHVQNSGETLKSIAKAVWGDANLWYLIANANNLDVDSVLTEGQTLKLPARANVVHNDVNTFTPYNADATIGDTTPTLPLPPPPPASSHGKCGGLGGLLTAAVAIAVTVVTGGATGAWALAAAAGSVASQTVAIAIGERDSFSWGEVLTSAVGGAVGGALNAGAAVSWQQAAANAAIANAATQGAGIVLGVQDRFDWRAS